MESVEALVSAVALVTLILFPGRGQIIIMAYICAILVFPALGDVLEELYGAQIAQASPGEALAFNTSIYSLLGFVGLVLAMPVGAFLSSRSLLAIVGVNLALSALAITLRVASSRSLTLPAPSSVDSEEFSALGERMPLGRLVDDVVRTGPVSPMLAAVMQCGATAAGIFLYLWIADAMPWSAGTSLAVVLATFGVGATIGPWGAPLLRRYLDVRAGLLVTYMYGGAIVLACMILVTWVPKESAWPVAIVYVFGIALFSRTRAVLTTTLRQEQFAGLRFASVMGWAFAFTSAGSLIGSWGGVGLRLDTRPGLALAAYLIAIVCAVVVVLRYVPKSKIAHQE